MNTKLLIILIAIIIFTTLNLFLKLLGYSFKAKKYGISTNAIVVGYYMYYDTKIIMWYPVVKFNKMNGEEVIARSRSLISLPVYKIGETIPIKYYANDISNIEYKDIYIDRISTKREKIYIDSSIKFKAEDYRKLVELCSDYEVYILDMIGTLRNMKFDKVKVIDFYKEIELNNDYLMVDKIHLTNSGNKAMTKTIKK